MKKIEAIIQPGKLCDLKTGLAQLGINGMTVYEVKGFGQGGGGTHLIRNGSKVVEFVPKVKIEVVVKDQLVGPTIEVIKECVWTGNIGDGKIFVTPIEQAIRIRTDETGDEALKSTHKETKNVYTN